MMKLNKISFLMLGALFTMSSCNDIDEQYPEGGTLTAEQVQKTNEIVPSRSEAAYAGMFSMTCKPCLVYPTSYRPDDAGFYSIHFGGDLEGADMSSPDNNFNWFSTACELSSRNANYANPMIRFKTPYNQIGAANAVVSGYAEDIKDPTALIHIANAKAIRAFDYMSLAPYFSFGYIVNPEALCIPLLTTGVDYSNNPRATVKEVFSFVISELDDAVAKLKANEYSRTDKSTISLAVALGLRARAKLFLNDWDGAAKDAADAITEAKKEGIEPMTIEDIQKGPAFCDIKEKNWMWGADITDEMVKGNYSYSGASAWISSFSGDGYAAACQTYAVINKLLYDKISDTDVRKGWWVDENLESPLLANVTWGEAKGNEVATLKIKDVKEEFLPYTNVKFGMYSGVGNTLNNNDWPLMRVEEMYLTEIEGLAHTNEGQAIQKLNTFVKTYRDPQYNYVAASAPRTLLDEIWFQRRVELWGEGFYTPDAKRLNKDIVRFHGPNTSNYSDAFQFNIKKDDGWLNMRFPQTEMNNNAGIIDNTGGSQPVAGQNPELRDGVTD